MPLIEVTNLKYVYNAGTPEAVVALDGVSLRIERGEYLAVVGGNGSGKSTLAKHLNALLLPTEGDVIVDGMNTKDHAATWDIRRRVGMVFQNPDNQIVATVVEEDVAFGPENLGVPPDEIRARVDGALTAVDMFEYRRKEPHLLSGGQKQRVAVEVVDTIARLVADGITVIHITHSMDEALRCHRVVAMAAGRIALDGPPEAVFSRVDDLERLRLALPPIPRLAHQLRRAGLPIPPDTFGTDQLADALTALTPAEVPDGPH